MKMSCNKLYKLYQLYPIVTNILFQSHLVVATLLGITLVIIPPLTLSAESQANLIQTIDTPNFPGPDTLGIVYIPSDSVFWVADSEINEMWINPGLDGFCLTADYSKNNVTKISMDDFLFIVSSKKDDLIVRTNADGILLRNIDISLVNSRNPAGLALAPNSVGQSMTSLKYLLINHRIFIII